jgi:hypothetical protein
MAWVMPPGGFLQLLDDLAPDPGSSERIRLHLVKRGPGPREAWIAVELNGRQLRALYKQTGFRTLNDLWGRYGAR